MKLQSLVSDTDEVLDADLQSAVLPVASRRWRCSVCGFIYDEKLGLPLEGIAPGTAWEDVPEWWTCPDCGVRKSDFVMALIAEGT